MKRVMRCVPVLVALGVGSVACSGGTAGIPTASEISTASSGSSGGGPFPTGGSSRPPSTTSDDRAPGPLAGTSPCSLLSAAELAQLGVVGPGTEKKVGEARSCTYYGHLDGRQFLVGVAIYDELGLDDLVGREKRPVSLGKHQAIQSIGGIDTCAVSIGVTETSRVDTAGGSGGNEERACGLANRAAQLVDPKLP